VVVVLGFKYAAERCRTCPRTVSGGAVALDRDEGLGAVMRSTADLTSPAFDLRERPPSREDVD